MPTGLALWPHGSLVCLPIGDSPPDSPRPMPTALTYIYIKMDMSRRLQAAARHWLDPLAALHRARAERRLCIVVPVRMLRMLRGVLTGYSRGYAADVSRGFDG